jgi:DNA modification methylase
MPGVLAMTVRILEGDVRERLADLPDASVQCVVTSPPYYGLRDYGVVGQIGLEPTLAEYIATMVDVFRDVRRVLRDDGTLWLNIGDSYSGAGTTGGATEKQSTNVGSFTGVAIRRDLKPKDLMMVPARLAIALQDDGWYLRSDIIWHKPNPMPESVTDRPTSSHEHIFLLTKQARYFYDADAVREDAVSGMDLGLLRGRSFADGANVAWHAPSILQRQDAGVDSRTAGSGFRNQRNVWTIATKPFSEAHFATFPPEIPRRCIKAGSKPGDTVLDPFGGSGTTLLVADRLGRHGIGVELNPEYAAMARRRITADAPLLVEIGA